MHEYSLMDSLLEHVNAQLGPETKGRVTRVHIVLGALEIHSLPSFQQAFVARSAGTVLEGAALEVEIQPAHIQCAACGHKATIDAGETDVHELEPVIECPECMRPCAVEGGHGVGPIQVTLDD